MSKETVTLGNRYLELASACQEAKRLWYDALKAEYTYQPGVIVEVKIHGNWVVAKVDRLTVQDYRAKVVPFIRVQTKAGWHTNARELYGDIRPHTGTTSVS